MEQNETLKHSDMEIVGGKLILSDDFKVLMTIYEQTIIHGEKINFSELYKLVKLKPDNINKSLEQLISRDIIYMRYAYLNPDKRSMCYFVADRFVPFSKGIYDVLEKKGNQQEKEQQKSDNKSKLLNTHEQTNEFK